MNRGSHSVKFTVVSSGYFDDPGSTITFSIYSRNGCIYLRQHAHGMNHNWIPAEAFAIGAWGTWARQAQNLRNLYWSVY